MPLNSLLVLLSSLNVAATTQEAGMDTQLVAPVLTNARTVPVFQAADDRVTVHFDNAKVSEVLAWLEDRGVSFVIVNSTDLPADATITLNARNEPIDSVVNAIGKALGGHWEKEGGLRVFHRDAESRFFSPNVKMPDLERLPIAPDFAKQMQDQFGPDFQKKMEAQEKLFRDQFGPKFQKEMEQQGKDLQKQFGPDFQKKMEAQEKLFRDQFGPKFQKEMEQRGKDLQKQFGPDFQKKMEEQGKLFQDQFGPKFQKEMEQQGKDLQKQFGPDFQKKMEEQGKLFQDQFGPKFQKEMGQQFGPDFEKLMRDMANDWSKKGADVKKFLGSITKEQRDLMGKQGYLGWDDLSPEQQRPLGGKPGGKFEIRYTADGGDVVIRGK